MMNYEVILKISWLKHHNSDINFKLRTVQKCVLINEMMKIFKSFNKDLETQLSEQYQDWADLFDETAVNVLS